MKEETKNDNELPLSQLEEQVEDILERLKKLEADESTHYPQDTYSLISLNSPDKEEGETIFFLFGIMIWSFQMLFICLLLASVFVSFFATEEYYAGDRIMMTTEFAAIVAYSLIPDASLQDIVTASQLWPRKNAKENILGRKIACTLRALQGIGASVCVLFLINISASAIDIILNFAALNFVSDMDSVAFELCAKGVFGRSFKDESERIMTKALPETVGDNHHPYRVAMIFCFVAMTTTNIVLWAYPEFAENLYTSYSIPQE